MSTDTLEPRLTKMDRRVLSTIPACGRGDEYRKRGISETVTLWQIAEALDTFELDSVRLTVSGLLHLGYIWSGPSMSRSRTVYWRTPKGDAVLDGEGC